MYKACIFDLDGTLTDTLDSLVYSVNETMKEVGAEPITREQCRRFVGNGARKLVERALRANGEEQMTKLDAACEAYSRIFDENCTYGVSPYPGVMDLLKSLKELGIKTAVLSNKPHRQTVRVAEDVLDGSLFDCVQGQKDNVPKKPDPAAALLIAEEFGVLPQETVYIGDSEVDLETGKAAGMLTVLVSWGFRDRQVLVEAGAGNIVDSAEEILEFLKEDKRNGRI